MRTHALLVPPEVADDVIHFSSSIHSPAGSGRSPFQDNACHHLYNRQHRSHAPTRAATLQSKCGLSCRARLCLGFYLGHTITGELSKGVSGSYNHRKAVACAPMKEARKLLIPQGRDAGCFHPRCGSPRAMSYSSYENTFRRSERVAPRSLCVPGVPLAGPRSGGFGSRRSDQSDLHRVPGSLPYALACDRQ